MSVIDRVGEVNYNKYGSKITIIEHMNASNTIINFDNGYTKRSAYKEFKNGSIKSPYCKSVCGVGFIGEGEFKTATARKNNKMYECWRGILRRVHDKQMLDRCPTYRDVTICEEWYNFQNFAKWYEENYYEVEGQMMHLDKDILVRGNRIYSPDTCIFVPRDINVVVITYNKKKSKLPVGVSMCSDNIGYVATCNNDSGNHYLGYFKTVYEASNTYKEHKRKTVIKMAEKYKGKIPVKLYEALLEFEV